MELWSRVLPSVGVECAGGSWSCGRYHSLDQEEEAKVSSPKPLATHTSPPLVVKWYSLLSVPPLPLPPLLPPSPSSPLCSLLPSDFTQTHFYMHFSEN